MKKTPVEITKLGIIDYNNPICFLGSCFSVNLSKKLKYCNFEVQSNPFGVIFNPLSIAEFLIGLKSESVDLNIVQRNDVYFSWEANSSVYGYSEQEIYSKLKNASISFEKSLSKSKMLFVTFGTAWIYELIENSQIVANCHKFDQSKFKKRLLSIDEITAQWKKVMRFLNNKYPEVQIVFTLSPVRHMKDGLIENARSKAILLESIYQLKEEFKTCHYFPAYEIIMDELRDYAFFKIDGIHPNEIAINEVWGKFVPAMFTLKAQEVCSELLDLRKLLEHKIQFEESEEAQKFTEYKTQRLIAFKQKYPQITLNI